MSWADIEIEASEWSVFCHDCPCGTFTATKDQAEQWGAEHRATAHDGDNQ